MSQLKLTADSGGGTVAIKGPASTTGNNAFELTVPGTGNSTLATTATAGKILSVTQTVKTDTFSQASVGVGAITNDVMSVSFAATSSSNKLLIHYSLSAGVSTGNRMSCVLAVGGTIQSAFRGDAASNRTQVMTTDSTRESWAMCNLSGSALISSPSTSSTTYSFRLIHGDNSSNTVYLNRSHDDNDNAYMHRPVSIITIMEVAA